MNKLNIGIIGCGDYVTRWESTPISNSNKIQVKSLFDIDSAKAGNLKQKIGGEIVSSADDIFNDKDISIVCIFVPPWNRKDLMIRAANHGKHIIATKPLAANVADCEAIVNGVNDKVKCGVFYRRCGDALMETLKHIFESGEIGKLALYKQDWLHHYPQWNDWATDPEKNGGPFMDAMVHNLNIVRYFMGRKTTAATLFSDNHSQDLKCKDTEFMKVDFEENGSAHLFITWAADLEVFSMEGNDREHIDIWYMITDQGWYVTIDWNDDSPIIKASREGEIKTWTVNELEMTPYDAMAAAIETDSPLRSDIVSLQEALEDIILLKEFEKKSGTRITISI
jgi:predicted dehydrogenase